MRRDDLRVWPYDDLREPPGHVPVSDADLASLGLVQAPVCDDCEGRGWQAGIPQWSSGPIDYPPCPSCGGSGWGRLYPVDGIDVVWLRAMAREELEWHRKAKDYPSEEMLALVEAVLAAIDQEDTDG